MGATTNTYDIGDKVRTSFVIKDADGNLADPTTVRCKYKDPEGTVTTKLYGTDSEVVRDSVGNYHLDFIVTSAGFWHWRWESEHVGSPHGADEGTVRVRSSEFS